MSPLLNSPAGAPMENDVHPVSPPPHVLLGPQEGALPKRAPAKRDAPFLESSNYLLKFPVNGLTRFPSGPLRREAPISRAFFYTFPSKSPVNEPPSMFPNRAPMEKEASSPEPMVCSFIYICQSPQLGAVPRKTRKTFGHRPRSPTWMEDLHTMECSLVPQGDCLRHCNLCPSAVQPSTQYFPPWFG